MTLERENELLKEQIELLKQLAALKSTPCQPAYPSYPPYQPQLYPITYYPVTYTDGTRLK